MSPRRTSNSRLKHSIRKEAAEIMRPTMLRPDNICHWCRKPVRSLRSINPEQLISIESGFVTFNENGARQRVRVATIDHLLSFEQLGVECINDPQNLVVACRQCNGSRHKAKSAVPRGCLQSPHCFRCGKPKEIGILLHVICQSDGGKTGESKKESYRLATPEDKQATPAIPRTD